MRTTNHNPRRGESGISLIECLIYVSMVVVILGVSFSVFYHMMDGSRALKRATDDIVRALDAGERWRDELHAATGALRLTEIAGGQRLVVPQARGEIVYEFQEHTLWRQTANDRERMPWLAGVKTSAMIRDQRGQVAAWRWELELQTRTNAPGGPRVKPLFTFQAVAGRRVLQ